MTEEHTFESHMQRGRELTRDGYLDAALEQFQHAAMLNPGDRRPAHNITICYIGLSRWSDALASLEILEPLVRGRGAPDELQALRMYWMAQHQDNSTGFPDLPSALADL